jgi:hypothetical protein
VVAGCWFAADEALFAAFQPWLGAFPFVSFFGFLLRVRISLRLIVRTVIRACYQRLPVAAVLIFGAIIRVSDSFVGWYDWYLERRAIQVGDERRYFNEF